MSTSPPPEGAWRGIFTFSLSDLAELANDKAVPESVSSIFWAPLTMTFVTTNIKDVRAVTLWLFNMIDFYVVNYRPFTFNDKLNEEFLNDATVMLYLEELKLYSLLASSRVKKGWLLQMIQRFVLQEKSRSWIDRLFGRR